MKTTHWIVVFSIVFPSCVSQPVKSQGMVAKEQITDSLVIFPIFRSGNGKALGRYNFRDHKLERIVHLSDDMSLEDVSDDKDVFLLKDKLESRVTAISSEKGKILFQREFDSSNKRIGAVRISPDKKSFVFSWRPKHAKVDDEIVVGNMSKGTVKIIPALVENEVTDLFWSEDGNAVFTVTYDGNTRSDVWVRTELNSDGSRTITQKPLQYFPPHYSRKKTHCGFQLETTTEGNGVAKQVRSIDKIEEGKRIPILQFQSGLESHPHGKNYTLWMTSSCRTALLRVHKSIYAINLENGTLAEILTDFAGTAEEIPSKIVN